MPASDTRLPAEAVIQKSPTAAALVTAAAVGLLIAGTLGTVGAVIIGASLHLLGVPDGWAAAGAAVAAAASLLPSAALARRVWRVERGRTEA